MIEQFHFIRPLWLLLLLLLPFLFLRKSIGGVASNWDSLVDPHLLQALKVNLQPLKRNRYGKPLVALALTIFSVALAGPTWSKVELPVFRAETSRVFILDLSLSMNSTDVKPSRLARAKLKLIDMLNAAKEGQTGLVTYAATPFVVAPLTDDAQTISAMVPALDTSIVPVQGSRTDLALEKAYALLRQTHAKTGDIILLGDDVDGDIDSSLEKITRSGYHVHVIAVGTEDGAPISLPEGGFLKDDSGAIVMPKLNSERLRELTTQGGGYFRTMSIDDSDFKPIFASASSNELRKDGDSGDKASNERWQDQGFWAALLLIPVVSLIFRRGVLVFMIAITLGSLPKPSMAFEWSDLWQTKDQQAVKLLKNGDVKQAAETFDDARWKGTSYFRSNDYENALRKFSAQDDIDSQYNAANSLAKLGRLEDALQAYEKVLERDPKHADAKYNRDLIDEFLKKQQQQSSQDQKSKENQKSEKSDSQNSSSQQSESSQAKDSKDDKQNSSRAEPNSSDDKKSDSKSQAEQKNVKSDNAKNETDQEKQASPVESSDKQDDKQNKDNPSLAKPSESVSPQDLEQQQALQQWLRRVPDDPSGLLREKYRRQAQQYSENRGEKKW